MLLLVMVWQALPMPGPMSVAAKVQEYLHAAMHLDRADHHHHEDGSLHQEAADQGGLHMHADGNMGSTGLPPGAMVQAAAARPAAPRVATAVRIPSPILDEPLRPPRISA